MSCRHLRWARAGNVTRHLSTFHLPNSKYKGHNTDPLVDVNLNLA